MRRLRNTVSELFRVVPVDESYGEADDLVGYVAELVSTWTSGVDEGVVDEVFGGFLPGWADLDKTQRESWVVRMLSAAGSDSIDGTGPTNMDVGAPTTGDTRAEPGETVPTVRVTAMPSGSQLPGVPPRFVGGMQPHSWHDFMQDYRTRMQHAAMAGTAGGVAGHEMWIKIVSAVEIELAQLWRKYAHASRSNGCYSVSSTCSSSVSAASAHAIVAAGGGDSDRNKYDCDAKVYDTGFDVLWPQKARACWWGCVAEPIILTLPMAQNAATLSSSVCVGLEMQLTDPDFVLAWQRHCRAVTTGSASSTAKSPPTCSLMLELCLTISSTDVIVTLRIVHKRHDDLVFPSPASLLGEKYCAMLETAFQEQCKALLQLQKGKFELATWGKDNNIGGGLNGVGMLRRALRWLDAQVTPHTLSRFQTITQQTAHKSCHLNEPNRDSRWHTSTAGNESAVIAKGRTAAFFTQSTHAAAPQENESLDWTHEQQQALTDALRKHPSTLATKERWTLIAAAVDGKSIKDCVARFKYIRAQAQQARHQEQAPQTQQAHKTSLMKELAPPKTVHLPQLYVELPQHVPSNGVKLCLSGLRLRTVATLQPWKLKLQIQCLKCPCKADVQLNAELSDTETTTCIDNHMRAVGCEWQGWCVRCSTLHSVIMHPLMLYEHAEKPIIALLRVTNCAPVDMLPSDLIAVCLECGGRQLLHQYQPGRQVQLVCRKCHTKLGVAAQAVEMQAGGEAAAVTLAQAQITRDQGAGHWSSKRKLKACSGIQLKVGQPLPNNGACEHYKHSYRWLRFPCCGKAFPCDICHEKSDCHKAADHMWANRQICGKCSHEAPFKREGVCVCGQAFGKKTSTANWEGGKGMRDRQRLSRNDTHKHKGQNKTISAKARREKERKLKGVKAKGKSSS